MRTYFTNALPTTQLRMMTVRKTDSLHLIKNHFKQGKLDPAPKKILPSLQPSISSTRIHRARSETVCHIQHLYIKILSNWGDPDHIMLSSLNLVDEKHNQLPIVGISSIPPYPDSGIENLLDKTLIKNESEAVWRAKWPPEGSNNIIIAIDLDCTIEPKLLRIWNPTLSDKAGVKDIEVAFNGKTVYEGEIPMSFGAVCQLKQREFVKPAQSDDIIVKMFSYMPKEVELKDSYGIYPLEMTKRIKIEILSTWSNQNSFGLNGLDLYDDEYHIIPWEDVEDIRIQNCISFTDPSLLFKPRKESIDGHEMLRIETNWDSNPILEVILRKNKKIVLVVFWNYNGGDNGVDYGIKDVRLFNSHRQLWSGRVSKSSGMLTNICSHTTPIWLTDLPSVRRKEHEK